MAGHSHWANISRKKSVIDAKRGKLWSKLAKAIIVAAKHGGPDPDGELKGGNLEESIYEGYAAGGVAVMCEILTDNKNRTAPEIRKIFEACDGKLGSTGCVAYLFQRVGVVRVPQASCGEDQLMELTLEAGASDVKLVGDRWEVTCEPQTMAAVVEAVQKGGLQVESNEIMRVPTNTVDVDDVDMARKVLDLVERLDDHDDVQSVAANFNIPDEALAQLG